MSAGVEATVAHPLDPLSADEVARAVAVVRAEKDWTATPGLAASRWSSPTSESPPRRTAGGGPS